MTTRRTKRRPDWRALDNARRRYLEAKERTQGIFTIQDAFAAQAAGTSLRDTFERAFPIANSSGLHVASEIAIAVAGMVEEMGRKDARFECEPFSRTAWTLGMRCPAHTSTPLRSTPARLSS